MAKGARDRKELRKTTHGWFNTPDRPGDRTIEQQMRGLVPLLACIKGKTVLDLGCAEGLVGMECVKAGASYSLGIEFVKRHIEVGRAMAPPNCELIVADANDYEPDRQFDVVLMLAILHKLKNPTEVCQRIAVYADELCVIRLPVGAPVIIDARSNSVPHDINYAMGKIGFGLEKVEDGPFNEWTGYYRRGHR